MPVWLRGDLACNGCGKTATASAQVLVRSDAAGVSLWWDLPEGWTLFGRSGSVTVYCTPACNKYLAVSGYPDQTGKPSTGAPSKFDPRTLDKIFDLVRDGEGATADNVLAAIESVLTAWRVGTGNA